MTPPDKIRDAVRRGYSVDDLGNVTGPKGPRKTGPNKAGYLRFGMRFDGVCRNVEVHRLAGFIRFGEAALQPGIEVRHLNGIATDNRIENLAIGTHAQNMMDIPEERRREKARGAASRLRRYDDTTIAAVRADRLRGDDYATIMARYSLPKSTVSYIVNRALY